MHTVTKTVAIMAIVNTFLLSCSGSGEEPDSTTDVLTQTADRDIAASDVQAQNQDNEATAGTANEQTTGDIQANPAPDTGQASNVTTRSPQGIRGDGDRRRQDARNGRNRGDNNAPTVDQDREVRTYDGSANNQNNRDWGASFAHLQRIAPAGYGDGVSTMAGASRAGARQISNALATQHSDESVPNTIGASDFSWQWGQFLDHDINLTDGSDFEAANIPVPAGDLWFDPAGSGDIEIPFNRALFDPATGTDFSNPRQQENEITSWIDGSMVYGSNTERLNELRVGGTSPLLKTSAGNLLPFNVNSITNANGFVADPTSLFLAGDVRANEQVGLTAMHILFVREHNRLAAQIRQDNPQASADNVFEAARRLVVAKIQIITYNEHLPALIGPSAIPAYDGYKPNVNGTIFNEFSSAAYRLGHSMINDEILRIAADGSTVDGGHLALRDSFFTAPGIIRAENDIDPILRGLASQVHQKVDLQIVDTLRNFLFGRPGSGGFDLTALNIQRGRDHGLASYNDTREAFGVARKNSFSDISSDPEVVENLQGSYASVDDIDMWIGGLAEDPVGGSQLGELFQEIVTEQFLALRDGDRFWYQNYLTDDELAQVQGTTLADVIRSNTNIGNELQDNVFFVPN